jgi:nitrate reductase NapAB chaperone NapD
MGLTCKPGAYNEVLKKLIFGLQLDQRNIFLLFGPIDILIQFNNLENLDDFVQNCFNKVKMVGAEENLLTKTLSLIVVSEGRLQSERPFAFLFLNAQPKNVENIQRTLLLFPEMLSADIVFGPYDLICSVRANGQEELERTISAVQSIPGVEGSVTSIVSTIRVLPDW